jgi:hypothetical protein
LKGYDEPEILPSSTRPICLIGADAGHQGTENASATLAYQCTMSAQPKAKSA